MDRKILFALILVVEDSSAYELERASNYLAHELADCSAYYMLSSIIVKAQMPETAQKLQKAGESANEFSAILTSEKLTLSRAEMATKTMLKEIDNDSGNFSILLNKYSDQCRKTVNNPRARMVYWLNKKD